MNPLLKIVPTNALRPPVGVTFAKKLLLADFDVQWGQMGLQLRAADKTPSFLCDIIAFTSLFFLKHCCPEVAVALFGLSLECMAFHIC